MDSTHSTLPTEPDPLPTESISSTVGDGLLPSEPNFDGFDVDSPSLKSDKSDLTDPQIFWHYLINLVSFEIFFG